MRPILPPLRLLAVFEAVTRSGSTLKAASDLNVTQPAVSQAVKALEEFVGFRLFDRSTRPVSLTPAGELLKTGVADGFERIAGAIEKGRTLQTLSDSAVTVACTVGTATYWLMPRVAEFYQEFPDIAVNVLTTVDSPELTPGIDMLIRYGMGNWNDGTTIKLFDEKVVPVFSPALADRITSLESLRTATLLNVVSSDSTWLTWNEYFQATGLPQNQLQGRSFSNYVQATQAALSGQGVMLGWESNTGDLVREKRLAALAGADYFPKEAFYLVTAEGRSHSRAAKSLTEWIKQDIAKT